MDDGEGRGGGFAIAKTKPLGLSATDQPPLLDAATSNDVVSYAVNFFFFF